MSAPQHAQDFLADVLRADRTRILARVVSLVGDLQLAEDALQEACVSASLQWSTAIPDNPQGWLVTVARRRAIDQYRSLSAGKRRNLAFSEQAAAWNAPNERAPIEDDRLRLIFTCTHPALSIEARVALTLQVVAGLTAADIAASFLVETPTMSQRIVRAKSKIRSAKIPYRVPEPAEWPERLSSVLGVVYLIFTTGHLAPNGEHAIRVDLLDEATRLAHLLVELIDDPEVLGLAALLSLTDARRTARSNHTGVLVDLQEQDRSSWDHTKIRNGLDLLTRANVHRKPGPYQLQAMIAAIHARSPSAEATNWVAISDLYDGLFVLVPSPVVAMNRAIAVGHARGPRDGLTLLDNAAVASELSDHHRFHAARAHLLEMANEDEEAQRAWDRAASLARSEHERLALVKRASKTPSPGPSTPGSSTAIREGRVSEG